MAALDGLLVAVRAVHYFASVVLFGEMVFAFLLVAPTISRQPLRGAKRAAYRRFYRVAVAAWGVVVISGACWLALVAVQMSGQARAAIEATALATVLGSTVFGRAWMLRALMALTLALFWRRLRAGPLHQAWTLVVCLVVTGGLLASLAWAGHANAEVGLGGVVHHTNDAAHLLAAGAWLGGLAPLARLLGSLGSSPTTDDIDDRAEISARFGNCAALSVGVLVLTGTVNAYFLVPEPRSLLDSTYGRVLLAKLTVFALMLAIAAMNRFRFTSNLLATKRDHASRSEAARRLKRNVRLEQALGAGVVVLVAVLGASSPPMRMGL